MKEYLFMLFCLLATNFVLNANVIFPSIVLLNKSMKALPHFDILLILASLFIEFIAFSSLMPHINRLKIAIIILLMNGLSAFIGLYVGLLGDFALFGIFEVFFKNYLGFELTEGDVLRAYPAWYTLFITLINTLIEFCVALVFFYRENVKKLFFYIFLINALTATLFTTSIVLYEYLYGPIELKY